MFFLLSVGLVQSYQFTIYTFCNATSTTSALCHLSNNASSINGGYDYLVPTRGNLNRQTFSTSQAIAPNTCVESGNYYTSYVLNINYKCSNTVTADLKIRIYIGNSTNDFLGYSYDGYALCDNNLRSTAAVVNVTALKNYYNLTGKVRVHHEVGLIKTGGTGDLYVEGEGQLSCWKDYDVDKFLNVNGDFGETFNNVCETGIGYSVIPKEDNGVTHIVYDGYPDYCYIDTTGGSGLWDGISISPLQFYVPNNYRVDVAIDMEIKGIATNYVLELTNGRDYTDTRTFFVSTRKVYNFSFYNLSNATYRKFETILNAGSGAVVYSMSVALVNETPITTTTTPITTTTPTGTPPATTTTIPTNVDAEISQISVSDLNPTLDQEITIKVKVTNTGQDAWDFPVGISIGNGTVICNRDCYTDGLGDYVHTGLIHSGQTVQVERRFKVRRDYFSEGNSYNLYVGVYPYEYLPPSQAYDYKILTNYINIVPLEDKLDVNFQMVKASKPKVSKGDIVDITAYVVNSGSISYNFTIGMSIGLWSADGKYKTIQAPLIPPCNVECYADNKGDWVHIVIPPNYTDPVKRSFIVPDYFLDDSPFDVAVSVYTDEPERGGKLIAIYYEKNVSRTTTEPSATQILSGQAKSAIDAFLVMISSALSISLSLAKVMLAVFIELFVVYMIYRSGVAGSDNKIAIISAVLLLTFGFMAIGWIPIVVGILVILVSGLILYTVIRG